MNKKKGQVANFNMVFGNDEAPMLEFFDSIVYPAFLSGITKKSEDVEYILKNIQISVNKKEEYVLVGKIVKKTMLEVLSDLDEEGELIEKDEKHSSAPYSTFAINLKNHRMLFVPNQKGSPTLVNFRSAIVYIITQYISKANKDLPELEKLPEALINIVGIPSSKSINEILENVTKVNMLTLKFYPLNGDIDFSGMFSQMTTDLRKTVGSKTGETVLRSPKSVEGITEVLEQAGGTINPILKVTTKENSKLTLRDYQISESYDLEFDEDIDFQQESAEVVSRGDELSVLNYTNQEHESIYEKNKAKIIPFRSR